MRRRGFSILEVVVALGILSMAMVVLVQSQATAVVMTRESEQIMTAGLLAKEKLNQVVLQVESEGFQEGDIEEEGDFSRGLFADFMPGSFDGNFDELNDDRFASFKWAYTVRKIDFSLGGDLEGMADTLSGAGLGPQDELQKEQMEEGQEGQDQMDLGDVGVSADMITDYLSPYIREVRVLVWWGENEDEEDQVEIVTHLINPSGQIAPPPGVPQSTGGDGGGDDGGDDGGGKSGGITGGSGQGRKGK